MTKTSFQLYVDTGGTFTDCIGIDSDGKPGRQTVIRKNGEEIPLFSIQAINLYAGDRFVIKTQSGEGFGE